MLSCVYFVSLNTSLNLSPFHFFFANKFHLFSSIFRVSPRMPRGPCNLVDFVSLSNGQSCKRSVLSFTLIFTTGCRIFLRTVSSSILRILLASFSFLDLLAANRGQHYVNAKCNIIWSVKPRQTAILPRDIDIYWRRRRRRRGNKICGPSAIDCYPSLVSVCCRTQHGRLSVPQRASRASQTMASRPRYTHR